MKVLLQGLVLAIASSFFVVPTADAAPPRVSKPRGTPSVPEPAALGLVAVGIAAAAIVRARKQK